MNITHTIFSYLCVSSVHIQQSDYDFLDHKWRKTFFIVRDHMMTDYCNVVLN